MPYLQHHDAHFPLALGETRVGPGTEAQIRVPAGAEPGEAVDSALVIITVTPHGDASLRVAEGDAGVFVNGVPVGREPAPLLHGDRVSILGSELRFAEEAKSGDTQEIPISGNARDATPSPGIGVARSRGRLVSLTDGREYPVPAEGLLLGRDAGCDVVIVAPNVSRRHARIHPMAGGYEVLDSSTNGLLVNGARVHGAIALARGDTLRVGNDDFRFYADPEPPAPPRSLQEVPSLQATAAIRAITREAIQALEASASPVAGAASSAASPSHGATVAPEDEASTSGSVTPDDSTTSREGVLAVLEIVNEGASKGERFELVAPLSHVGRGEHNDIALHDESVSESHAKIQRRDDAWYIVDMNSTNGTYIGGSRVSGEAQVASGSDMRFGGVKMSFRTVGSGHRGSGETRGIVGVKGPDPKRAEQRLKELARGVETREAPVARTGVPAWLWVVLALFAAFFLYLVLQGR